MSQEPGPRPGGPRGTQPSRGDEGREREVERRQCLRHQDRRDVDHRRDDQADCSLATTSFVTHRDLLFTVASRVLGSAADAEDVLQEAWLRWTKVDLGQVRDHRAFLVRVTTRLCLDRLRVLKRRKEAFVGRWSPEPRLAAPDVADEVELTEEVSTAIMVVLETLAPTERVVFVLREVFGFGYDEIATAVAKSPAAVRQIAHRARRRVEARRWEEPGAPEVPQAVVASFRHAAGTGDLRGLLDVLAPDVVPRGPARTLRRRENPARALAG